MDKMPDSITDGPDFEEDDGIEIPEQDPDIAYEQMRDEELMREADRLERMDELHESLKDIGAGLKRTPWK
jgi:hypothetical protein